MNAKYVPGDRAVAVGGRTVVMAATDHAAELASLLEREPTPLEVLSVLSGGDVAGLPDFAAVVVDGADLVVMARGSYTVRCGDDQWSGQDSATWREHRIAATAGEVTIEHGEGAGDLELPVSSGVVLAARVTWLPGPAPEGDDSSAPAITRVEPEPAAEAPSVTHHPDHTVVEADDEFDGTVGATVQGQRAEAPPETPPGDHDGRTITAAQLQELRAQQAPATSEAPGPEHATLAVSGGETVDLVQPVIIGRSPRADQRSSAQLPRLVVVDDPYVSGTHLEVLLEEGAVVAVDRSTNGTTLTRPGGEPERLSKDEPTVVGDGCVLGLSDDVTATVAVPGAAG